MWLPARERKFLAEYAGGFGAERVEQAAGGVSCGEGSIC